MQDKSWRQAGAGSRWRLSARVLRALSLAPIVASTVLALGCGSGASANKGGNLDAAPTMRVEDVRQPQQYGGAHVGGSATGDTEAGAAFARWVLEQDPQRRYITEAVVRKEQSLGVKVQPNVTKADVQKLLVSLAEGMARTFPNRAVQVIGFFQSGDKLAEATYDPRRGSAATVNFE